MFQRHTYHQSTVCLASNSAESDAMLNRPSFLRYDHSHGGFAASDDSSACGGDSLRQGEPAMDVTGAESVGGTGPIRRAQPTEVEKAKAPAASTTPDGLIADPAHRAEKLARIRSEIEAGTYESSEKLEAAVERLLSEIG